MMALGSLEYCQACPWWIEEYEGCGHCECPPGYDCAGDKP
jgi:hypothetical protein